MEVVVSMLFELLRFSLCETPFSCAQKPLDGKTLRLLYALSKKHDLAHLVGDSLDKNGLLEGHSEAKKRFTQERNMAVYRYEQMQYDYEQICETLEGAKIPFIPLKGSVIRPLYPQPWQRTSCDIDVLVRESDLQSAIALLEKELGYAVKSSGDHDVSLYAENGTHLELHYRLVEQGAKPSETAVLERVWERVELSQAYQKKLTDETAYCYYVSHVAKHLRFGGCGVRPLMDIWVLNHKLPHDKTARETLLKEAGLLTLAKALEGLSEVWFSGAETDETLSSLSQYVLTGGVYGTMDNRVAAQKSKKKNKCSYLLSRIFLPYSKLKYAYPKLQKYPILYPFYLIKRCCKLLKKDAKEKALREYRETASGDEARQARIARLLKDLEI